jgi:putative aldouronate transport system substrate-binding protein
MRTNRKVRPVLLGMAVSAGVVLLGGCSAKEEVKSSAKTSSEKPAEITMMNSYYTMEDPKADNVVLKQLENHIGSKLNITWVPNAAYNDKVMASISANNLPQVLTVLSDIKTPAIINSLRKGMFWEIGPYLKDYPNLSKINPIVIGNVSIDGKVYALPRTRTLAREGIVYRQDWLDNLGMKRPETIDEFYKMAKAFTEGDPDKNGKKDTYGFVEQKALNGLKLFAAWFGAPNGWGLVDGKLAPDFTTSEYMDALKFYKKLYDENLMNRDFAVTEGSKRDQEITSGKAGSIWNVLDNVVNPKYTDVQKLFPQAQLNFIPRVDGPKGPRVFTWYGGYTGFFLFPKSVIKDEAELKRILAAMDKMNDKEGLDLIAWGILDRHYKMENNKPVRINEKLFQDEIQGAIQLNVLQTSEYATQGVQTPMELEINKWFKENEKIVVADPTQSLISETDTQRGSELLKIISDANIKFIMGVLDQKGWEQEIERWKTSGGNKVIEEMNVEYSKAQKK